MRVPFLLAAVLVVPAATVANTAAPAAQATATCGAGNREAAVYGRNALIDIEFSSIRTGWAVGGSRALRTTDGGAHWHVVFRRAGAQLASVDAYDDRDAWAAGAHGLFATHDGGRTWSRLPTICPAIASVDFYSAGAGVAVAGGALLGTIDGGRFWFPLDTPPRVASACFSDRDDGWLGAGGRVFRTSDGGLHWQLSVAGPHWRNAERKITDALVECAGSAEGWGELVVGAGASNQQPHIGYHLSATHSRPVFAENYFPHPGMGRLPESPGSYFGAFSVIDPADAAFVDNCSACGRGTAILEVLTRGGTRIGVDRTVSSLNSATGAAFLSVDDGWVVGSSVSASGRTSVARIEHTTDGGRTWTTQYQS